MNKAVAVEVQSKFPARPASSRSTASCSAGGERPTSVWFDPNKGRMVAVEKAVGGPPLASTAPRRCARAQTSPSERAQTALARLRHGLLSVDRRPADRRARVGVPAGWRIGFWSAVSDPRRSRRSSSASWPRSSRRDQRRRRDGDRLGARTGRVPRQEPRQRSHRPAVRPADDRRGADAARSLRAAARRSGSTSRTRARPWGSRCCS